MRHRWFLACVASCLVLASAGGAQTYPPIPIGVGPGFHPLAATPTVLRGAPVGRLQCGTGGSRFGVHVELFARHRVLILPPGIGVARPFARDGAYIRPHGCTYPLRTLDPTGVIEVDARTPLTLGDLFRIWGQPLSPTRLADFSTSASAPVRAYVGGRRWHGSLGAIPLRRHAQIVVELGPYIPPHPRFLFRPGL
ncbi:MAG TPA: hypothetical protein VGF23_16420 [Gaiellaceae bacterium]|jgi:hypothetical protein